MEVLQEAYFPGDQRLIDEIVRELKSQGIFDQFRKECISDVDTKPAYQNLRQRVENSVSGFLTKQNWSPEMNKNQVREMVRKNIYESGFFEIGVERIVDQVVNPKINTVFFSKVEDVVYKILGIEKPTKSEKVQPPPPPPPAKITSFQDLIPKETKEPSQSEENIKKEVEDVVKIENESSTIETSEERVVMEETSMDSQCSVLSGVTTNSHESNNSHKQDSNMSMNSPESRTPLLISENTSMLDNDSSKIDSDDVFICQKSTDSTSLTAENTMENSVNEDIKLDSNDASNLTDGNESQNESKSEKIDNESKRERKHSSSDRSKSRNDKDKEKSRSDKNKKDETNKDQKDKEKYRIPKLSDKNKNEKDVKLKDKDAKIKDKESRTDKDKKNDKDKKSSRHSTDKDRSRNDKSRKDSRRDKEREKSDKKDSSRDKSRDDKISSKKRESSSSKDKHRDSNTKKSTEEKSKNGHTSSNPKKESSKSKKEDDKHKSSRKNDKDEKKRKRDSKDDHYSSRDKNNGRRSSDRDSDGPSNNKRTPTTPQRESEKYSTQKSHQESSCSNIESTSGDSGNSDSLMLELQKIKLPKFASNMQEAMKIVKIRKLVKKIENMHKSNANYKEMKKSFEDVLKLTNEMKIEGDEKKSDENEKTCEEIEKNEGKININDFISSNVSMAEWDSLEAKLMGQLGNVDYDSYESPFIDEEDSNYDNQIEENTIYESVESKEINISKSESANSLIETDNINKKAVIVLEKHPLTEELVRKRKNGEHSGDKSKTDQNEDSKLGNEKENIEINHISLKFEDSEKSLPVEFEDETECLEENAFKGFETSQNDEKQNVLQNLIETLDESLENDKLKLGKSPRRRGFEDDDEISNNNIENSVGTRGEINSIPQSSKRAKLLRKVGNEENAGIQNGFSMPSSPVETETIEKKDNVKRKIRVSRSANQRYSSDDLYKPRNFLRRSGKFSKDS